MKSRLLLFFTLVVLFTAIYFFMVNSLHLKISIFFRPDQSFTGIFNSNQLFIPYLYQDLFVHHAPSQDWTFSPELYFFPDAFVFLILAAIVKNIYLAILLANVLWLVLYYVLLIPVGTLVCGEKSKNIFRLSALISLLFASGALSEQEIFVPLWSSHFGSTILVYLVSILLILKLMCRHPCAHVCHSRAGGNSFLGFTKWIPTCAGTMSIYFLLAAIIFLTSFSDPYFFILFFGSVFFGLLGLMRKQKIEREIFYKILSAVFFAGVLGNMVNFFDVFHLGIHSFFQKEHQFFMPLHFSFLPLIALKNIFVLLGKHNPIVVLFGIAFLVFGVRFFFRSSCDKKREFVLVSIAFGILTTLISSILFDPDLMKANFLSLRHFQTALILPTFLCFPILLAQNERVVEFFNRYYLYFLTAMMAYACFFRPYAGIEELTHYYPPVTQCLDAYAQQGKLGGKNGVSEYWEAHVNDVLSKENLNVVAVNRFLQPYDWMSTRHDYVGRKFNFVLVRKNTLFSGKALVKWGRPDEVLICRQDQQYMIYVYDAGFAVSSALVIFRG